MKEINLNNRKKHCFRHKSVPAFLCVACALLLSCSDYLDIVPDNTLTLDDLFTTKEEAYNALAKTYSYMPKENLTDYSSWTMGDEYMHTITQGIEDAPTSQQGIRMMRGLQTTGSPLLGTWSGTSGAIPLYQGINVCNIFLDKLDAVGNMDTVEKAEWKAQVKFLKAYYHFLLLQKYGPIVISDKTVVADASQEELFVSRSKIDDCFDYIVKLMDEAFPDLMPRKDATDLGMVDQMVAAAIKARVLLFRASPFYSGNMKYFGDFFDHDGKTFFPDDNAAATKAKWKDAVDAIDKAITLCLENGRELYTYQKPMLTVDREDFVENRQNLQTYYDLRMVMADPTNKELIWGYSNTDPYGLNDLQVAANIMLPTGYSTGDSENNPAGSWNWLAATYKMAERYYTKNGLPLDEDRTFDLNNRYQLTYTPGPDDSAYAETRGILQPKAETIELYLNREPRFYANLGITGSYWRAHNVRISTQMYAGTDGGYKSNLDENSFCTGIGIQKLVNIGSKSGSWQRMVRYPYPIIRMADLYLMKAEALNEYLDAPNQEIWDAINKVRRRAGIPNVETVYSDANLATAKALNKHIHKDGMREIILHERGVELAFEGIRFWDMLRRNRAPEEFSTPVLGWMYKNSTGSDFFKLEVKQSRLFTTRDCLWPIDLNELNTNANLIQSPGW